MSHHSPIIEALAEFPRNRLALVGLILTLLIVLLVICSSLVAPLDPTELQPWVGAQPPGFSHPDCAAENSFSIGQPTESTAPIAAAKNLEITIEETTRKTIRIALRRGVVWRINQMEGAASLPEFDLQAPGLAIHELVGDQLTDRHIPSGRAQVDSPPPPGLFLPGQNVIFLQLRTAPNRILYEIYQEAGASVSIARNDLPVEAICLAGNDITKVVADGRELRRTHLLGTDDLGRDLFSRVLFGGRISLLVGVAATVVSLVIGVLYGATAGYIGGRVDRLMMDAVDILYAIPFMFLVIILLVLFGRELVILFVALGAVQWLTMARIVRGQVLSLKAMDYVVAAKASGAGAGTVIVRHILPNAIGPIIVYTTLTVPAVILEESFLAFIGLSVQYQGHNLDSWGSLVRHGMTALGNQGERSWLLIWPSVVMTASLFGLNALGDGLRDCFDPKTRRID